MKPPSAARGHRGHRARQRLDPGEQALPLSFGLTVQRLPRLAFQLLLVVQISLLHTDEACEADKAKSGAGDLMLPEQTHLLRQ